MPKSLFARSVEAAAKKGLAPLSKSSTEWYRGYVRTHARGTQSINSLGKSKDMKISTHLKMGHMYFFAYDAKFKDTLPYWDAAPLIIPISETPTTIMGLNLHYLPFQYRVPLMDALYGLLTNTTMDETTKLKVSYQILKSAAKYKYFKPCLKQYLKTNFMSKFIEVPVQYWETAIFLPVAQWKNASVATVHKDSTRIIKR